MKSLFYTLLILGGAFLAYDYFLAEPGTKIVFKSLNAHAPAPAPVVVKPAEEKTTVKEQPPVTSPEPVKPVVVETPPPSTPAPTAVAPSPAPKTKADSIEVLTSNWTKIPATAFPREVKLLQDAEFKMSVGASKVTAGSTAIALGTVDGVISLAPTATSPARAQLPIDGTDLKARLTDVYEKWKARRAEELKAQAALRQAAPAPVASSSADVDSSGKPVRGEKGTYPLLVASIHRGQVTEIVVENITNWQEPQPATIQGKNGWAVKVNFNANTVFGLQPAEAQALVLDGKVIGWYYTGSGEEVP